MMATDDDEIVGDDFDSMYKGEISKSGTSYFTI